VRHLLFAESPECVEVQMAETLMPFPRLIILARRKTERLCSLKMQNIQPFLPSVYLGKQTAALVPNAKHTIVNLNLGPSFIKLSRLRIEFFSAGMK
jgi:hypothetical protein